ncbi:MAG: aldolase/citrate lyase family protein [Chloroflexota bacterium]
MSETINQKLSNGQTIIGQWVSLSDPAVVEAMAQTGFDFLLIDGEHSPIGESELANLLRAGQAGDSAIIYRVRENSESLIKMALDLGVDGVFVPRVNSPTEAEQAVAAAKYPPLGKRGVGPWRASNYFQNMDEYVTTANEATTLILQIEDIAAVEQIDEILAVEGIDAVYIGPADLSASLGILGQQEHPDFVAAIDQVAEACQAAGTPLGFDTQNADHLAQLAKQGFQILTLGMDLDYIISGAKGLSAEIRSKLN